MEMLVRWLGIAESRVRCFPLLRENRRDAGVRNPGCLELEALGFSGLVV